MVIASAFVDGASGTAFLRCVHSFDRLGVAINCHSCKDR